jgi:hypothetical protein
MKKFGLRTKWEETKGRREYNHTCLAPDEEIATMGNNPIKTKGERASAKLRRLPGKTTTVQTKKGQHNYDNPPSVDRSQPKRSTQKKGRKAPMTSITDVEHSCSSA